MFFKRDVLKNFAIFLGKHLSLSLFLYKIEIKSRYETFLFCENILLFPIYTYIFYSDFIRKDIENPKIYYNDGPQGELFLGAA